jgi:Tfp pilus assembly protein PilF
MIDFLRRWKMPSSDLKARMYFDQGEGAAKRDDHNAAQDYFRLAVEQDPMFSEAHQRLAETYEKLGYAHRAKKAWQALQRIAKDPAVAELCNQRLKA